MNINTKKTFMIKSDQPDTLLTINKVCFSHNTTKQRETSVLKDVSFDIKKGEFLCLLGPSGCGKTTLLRLVAGLEEADGGRIQFAEGFPNIGMVFQDLALFPHMSAARNIGYGLRHLSRAERRTITDEMLSLVGLTEKRGSYPHELSGGQKQRLALARALARKPSLILLDEPFASQDITLRAQMRDDVMHILREAGVAALLVTHDPEEAMQFADRIAIMNAGIIQQIGTPTEIYNHPNSAFVASFFGQVNVLKGHVQNGLIKTTLGTIEASNFDDDTAVDIIIRPEALHLSQHDPMIDHNDPKQAHVHGIVSEQKYLGRSTLIHMDTHDIDKNEHDSLHLHARIPGNFSNAKNTIYDIALDQSQIFVFADNPQAT